MEGIIEQVFKAAYLIICNRFNCTASFDSVDLDR